jgi:hypothetical protein
MFFEERELLFASPVVVAHGREDFKGRIQCPKRHFESHLVVAGCGATVGNRSCASFTGEVSEP